MQWVTGVSASCHPEEQVRVGGQRVQDSGFGEGGTGQWYPVCRAVHQGLTQGALGGHLYVILRTPR